MNPSNRIIGTDLRHALVVFLTSPLLFLAAICDPDDDNTPTIFYDDIARVEVSQGPVFTLNDTIWITGRFTSMAYDSRLQDSIPFPEEFVTDNFRIGRMETASTLSGTLGKNAEEAVDEFDFVIRSGNIGPLGSCPTASLIAIAPLTDNGENFLYEIGLKPRNTGDFVLSWNRPVRLQNPTVNIEILEKYPWQGDGNYLGFTACGITTTQDQVAEEKRDFFFTVE